MVYCNLQKMENNILTYAIGGSPKDLTGILSVSLDDYSHILEKKPNNSTVHERHIDAMIRRHIHEYKNKIFERKISYEIG